MCIGAGGSCGATNSDIIGAINSGGSGAAGSSFVITLYLSSTTSFTLLLCAVGSVHETRFEFASGYYHQLILAVAYTGGNGTAATISNPGSGGIAALPADITSNMTGLTGLGNQGSDGYEHPTFKKANQTGINFMFYNTGNGISSYGAGGYAMDDGTIIPAGGGACIITKYSIT